LSYHKLYNYQQQCYLTENRIKHTGVTPYWERANGLVENFNKSLKKAIRVATIEKKGMGDSNGVN
jgi:hypothetical protein